MTDHDTAAAAPPNLWPDDLGEPLVDDDLIRNGLWSLEGPGAAQELGDAENWDYQEVEDAWTAHAATQLAERGITWDADTDKVTVPAGMTTEDATAIWQDVAGRVLAGFDAWIEAIVADARAGKHLAPPEDVRPASAPGARWITRADPS